MVQVAFAEVSATHADEAEHGREEVLQRLVQSLDSYQASARSDRASFAKLIESAQLVLEIDDRELARRLGVSRPTIGRWARGETAPHPIGRQGVLRELKDVANERLKIHHNYRRRAA